MYKRSVPANRFVTPQLAREMTELTSRLGRRIGLLVDRRGQVDKVIVGDAHRVFLPDLGARRAGAGRFRGVRLILTALRPDGLTDEDLTDLVLLQLDAVVTIFAGPDGLPGRIHFGHLMPPDVSEQAWRVDSVPSVHGWEADWLAFIQDVEAQFRRSPQLKEIEDREATILVGVSLGNPRRARRSMGELERLADTAGFHVVKSVIQNRAKLDGRFCVGKGKLQELILESMRLGAGALIFDRELAPSQLRNIAEQTDLKVLDRTQVILDIFSQHASTREGKLQVELAQLRYRMPRLAAMATAMSRLTGGIGGRGPGETKLEINKRRAQERLERLEKELGKQAKNRATRRKRRTRQNIPVVSIVGYTNAGKSTLLNRITQSAVLVEDKLFATLDPTSRRFRFPMEREIILTDTVGFIEDLPKTLVQAFRSTLEALDEADLLLHVLDASDTEAEHHLQSVQTILGELGVEDTPVLLAWNKAEIADPEALAKLIGTHGGLPVSALTGEGFEALQTQLEQGLFLSRAASEADPIEQ